MLPLVWGARRRCIEFWLEVMRMDDKWVFRMVTLEAQEHMQNKVSFEIFLTFPTVVCILYIMLSLLIASCRWLGASACNWPLVLLVVVFASFCLHHCEAAGILPCPLHSELPSIIRGITRRNSQQLIIRCNCQATQPV